MAFASIIICIYSLLNRLKRAPETLDQLGDSLELLEQLQTDIPNMEAQFEPLNDQFNILHKYEVPVPEEVEIQREGLQGSWMAFQQCLIDSEAMLKKHKVSTEPMMMLLHVVLHSTKWLVQ